MADQIDHTAEAVNVRIQATGSYNWLNAADKSTPVKVTGPFGSVSWSADVDEFERDDLDEMRWCDLIRLACERVATRYLYHGDVETAKQTLAWLDDDPEEEHDALIWAAEREYRLVRARSEVLHALRHLGNDDRDALLAEVAS